MYGGVDIYMVLGLSAYMKWLEYFSRGFDSSFAKESRLVYE